MSAAPTRTVYLADHYEHAARLRPPSGDFLGVVENKATYVRHQDAWKPCSKQDVMAAFWSRGRLLFADVPAPAPPVPPKDKAQ